jgi:hypothetical protein
MPSPAATQVFAVRRKLVALLAARANLSTVQVTYGWPGADKATRTMIYTDARATGDQAVAAMRNGRTHYNERARFDVTIRVEAIGGNQQTADTTCETLALELAECVADNRTLATAGVALVNWVRSTGWVNDSGFNDHGYLALLTYTFEYDARLT